MAAKKQEYEQKFRFSYSPTTAVGMGAPSGKYNRMANLSDHNSLGGLQSMHGGEISQQSARKIRNAVEWLLAAASEKYVYSKKTKRLHKWKLSFLTLTLPTQGNKTDLEIKSLLNSFLTLAKYNYGLRSYIWKAEPQKRGAIHFHITSDCYMWKNSVRFEWNRLLSKSGLLNGHTDAPSTKIHSTYKVKNMAAYLTKYFIKPPLKQTKPPYKPTFNGLQYSPRGHAYMHPINLESLYYVRPLAGRLWGCSQTLSQARNLSYIVDTPEMRTLNDELRVSGAVEKQKAYCNFFMLPNDYYSKLSYGQLKHDYTQTLLKIRKRNNFSDHEIWNENGEPVTDTKILLKFAKQLKHT